MKEGEGDHSMITSEQYYMSLQANVRFQPTDQELITHFLTRKTNGHPLPMNIIIDELSFYNYGPAQLSQMYEFANQKEMYFFTRVARKYANSPIPQRTAGNGYWKSTSPYLDIKDGDRKIGVKKSLRFYAGSRKDSTKTNWIMMEYKNDWAFISIIEDQHILYEWVLCKVYENESNAKRVPDSNNQGKAAKEEVTGEQLHPHKKRRCLSKNSGQLSLATCTGSYQRPSLPELPFEVIIEILSWLPVESVLKFKCVCREWCSLFQQYEFIAKHRVRASRLKIPYRFKWEANNLVPHYDENFKLISCSGGLFLEESLASQVFRIRNFAMHQVLYLPHALDADTSKMDFCLNSSTGECKVACFYCKNERVLGSEVGFKVVTVGRDYQWRPLKLPNQNDKSVLRKHGKYVLKRHCLEPNNVEGAAHVAEIIRDGQELYLEVQSLDLWSECLISTTLPQGVFQDLEKVSVLRWNHHLAVGEIAEETLNVLALEDFKKHKWSKNKIEVPLKFLEDNPRAKNKIRLVRALFGKIELHMGVKTLLEYNMKRKILNRIVHKESGEKQFAVLNPSLMTYKGMRVKRVMLEPRMSGT